MTDDLNSKGSADRDRVSLMQQHEVKYWTEKWSVTELELQNAVDATGPMVDKVEIWLRTHGKIK